MNAFWGTQVDFPQTSNLNLLLDNAYMMVQTFVFLTYLNPDTRNFKVRGRNSFLFEKQIEMLTLNIILGVFLWVYSCS